MKGVSLVCQSVTTSLLGQLGVVIMHWLQGCKLFVLIALGCNWRADAEDWRTMPVVKALMQWLRPEIHAYDDPEVNVPVAQGLPSSPRSPTWGGAPDSRFDPAEVGPPRVTPQHSGGGLHNSGATF
jgi:hypothetical protein